MPKLQLTISKLSELLNTTPRSIHFYRKEGLLKGKLIGAGRGTRYTEEHLIRLLVIRKLQKSHLKLSGIKQQMDNMSFVEMEEFVQDELNRLEESDKIATVEDLDNSFPFGKVEFDLSPSDSRKENLFETSPNDISFLEIREDTGTRPRHAGTTGRGHILSKVTRTATFQRESWQRISITDGVELNIRRDVLHRKRREIDQVLREIRGKLDS